MRALVVLAALALVACAEPPAPNAVPDETAIPTVGPSAPSAVPDEAAIPTAEPGVAAPGALRTADGAPIVVVIETRDRSMAVTADLVTDPSRDDLRDMLAPHATASTEVERIRAAAGCPGCTVSAGL